MHEAHAQQVGAACRKGLRQMLFNGSDAGERVIDFLGEAGVACSLLLQSLDRAVNGCDLGGESRKRVDWAASAT
jgi:hypothetical protein